MPAYVEDDGDNGDLNGDKQRACDRKGRLYVLPMNLKTERGLNTQYPGSVGVRNQFLWSLLFISNLTFYCHYF